MLGVCKKRLTLSIPPVAVQHPYVYILVLCYIYIAYILTRSNCKAPNHHLHHFMLIEDGLKISNS